MTIERPERPNERLPTTGGRPWTQVALAALLIAAGTIWAVVHFVRSAPPHVLTIATGPKDSTFQKTAERYRAILARSGITLNILETEGSLDNLKRLDDPKAHVDIALVQSGLTPSEDHKDLMSLGSMFYEPLMIFYRGQKTISRLSELAGLRIAVGPVGSGTEALALDLLEVNGIEPNGSTKLVDLEGDAAAKALLEKRVDAVILTGDSASMATMRDLLHEDGVRLFEFAQADAYVRRFPYLNKLQIPAGAFDLGEGLPRVDTTMLAPTVELVARADLHPALSDLLLEAAFHVHGNASLLQTADQFPNLATHTLPISADASRYYKSGDRSFVYRYLPFWLASFVNRIVVSFLPILVIVIPALRILPQAYNWRITQRLNRRYNEIGEVERATLRTDMTNEHRAALRERLEKIEHAIVDRKVPGSHAEHVFLLRQHIDLVHKKLEG